MLPMASALAVDLRGDPERLGRGSRRVYEAVRRAIDFENGDWAREREVALVAANLPC
jgi:hypothetical protein